MTNGSVIILGAGLMGRLLALRCAKEGFTVNLYEKNSQVAKDSAAYAAAAMLAPMAESVSTEKSIVQMGLYSLSRWPKILEQLSQRVYFQQNGSLILWHPQDQSLGKHFLAQINKSELHYSLKGLSEWVEGAALCELEPQLQDRFHQGIFLPTEGQLDNRELLEILLTDALSLGVIVHWEQAKTPSDFHASSYDYLIDCRGLGAKKTLNKLRGVRGEVLRVFAPEVKLHRPIRLLHPRYPIYIAPKSENVYVIGATEIESEDFSSMSVRSALELLSAAYSLHSGFAEARILEMNAQCRPSLPDNLPLIETNASNHITINGLYRHGYLISPAIVDSVMALLTQHNDSFIEQFGLTIHKNLPLSIV